MVKVTVLGAGNAGFSIAFHLAQMKHSVALYEYPDFKQSIEPVIAANNVIIASEEESGYKAVVHGEAKLDLVTSEIGEAIAFGEVIMIIVPAFGQVPIFEFALPHMKPEQILISMPGNFASLQYAKIIQDKGLAAEKKLYFVDTDSIPYACRKLTGNRTFISNIKKQLNTGVYPSEASDKVFATIEPLFSLKLLRCKNVLEAAFANMNMIFHPPPTIYNAGWIEATQGNYSFYGESCTPSVCRVMLAVDAERMNIAKALGLKTDTVIKIDRGWYGSMGTEDIYEILHTGEGHEFFRGPPSLKNRYIDEDMCYILIPIVRLLAARYKVPTPVCDAMILSAEVLRGEKLEAKRNFEHVVKDGESIEQMHQRLAKWMA